MWTIKRSWTDNTELSYEEEVMLANILCQHCAGKVSYNEASSIAIDIAQDIRRKIGEVSGDGILPILSATDGFKLFIYENICGVIPASKPIKVVKENVPIETDKGLLTYYAGTPVYYCYEFAEGNDNDDIEEDN